MCGIAGCLNQSDTPLSPIVLKAMADAIQHRGPDGEGFFIQEPIALAHRRLSILDLSAAGHQPMQTPDGCYTLVFNGEVYNFQELRLELEAKGRTFRSRTDSEVVLMALVEWGAEALSRFNGMFALAFWNQRTQKLLLARDRYGVKPLYYSVVKQGLLFASEIKAFHKHPDFAAELDAEGLLEYMTFQNFFTSRTLWNNVRILPAGCFWELSADTIQDQRIRSYWDFRYQEPEQDHRSEESYIEELLFLFRQAVNRQLVSDVEVGAYLSSGMDSGSITAVASQNFPSMKTFTVGFDLNSASGMELAFDEREKAEYMSYLFKTEHYEMVLKAGDMERIMPRMCASLDEPRVGQSYPNYYAAQLAGRFCKVVLAGTGGDELFGGYPWRYYRAVRNDSFDAYIDKYFSFWQRLMTGAELEQVFTPIWSHVKHVRLRDIFRSVFHEHAAELSRPEDYINHSLYFESKTFLHGLFVVDDKLSMAHSLETRVPFMDNDLVEFAMKLPIRMKLGRLNEIIEMNENEPGKFEKYFEKTRDGKLILRKAFRQMIPSKVLEQTKQGFSAPDASWFKGESIDYVRSTILKRTSPLFDVMDFSAVNALVSEHLEGKRNRRLLIWSLLNLHHTLKNFRLA